MTLSFPVFLEPLFLFSVTVAFAAGVVLGGAAALTFIGRRE